jgi:hypothetical protein
MLSLHSVFAKVARLFISNGGTQATREAADPVIQVRIHQLMKNLSLQELPSETGIRGFKPLQCKSSKLMGGFSLEMDDRMTCCLRGLIHAGPPLLAGHGQLMPTGLRLLLREAYFHFPYLLDRHRDGGGVHHRRGGTKSHRRVERSRTANPQAKPRKPYCLCRGQARNSSRMSDIRWPLSPYRRARPVCRFLPGRRFCSRFTWLPSFSNHLQAGTSRARAESILGRLRLSGTNGSRIGWPTIFGFRMGWIIL